VISTKPVQLINSTTTREHGISLQYIRYHSKQNRNGMARGRIQHILRKISVGSIMIGDSEVATSISAQNEFYKRLNVVMETQKALLHKTLKENAHMIDPKTGEVMLR
jgi:hypothetical protein